MLHLNLCWNVGNCPPGIWKVVYLQKLIFVTFTVGNAASANVLYLRDLKGLTLLKHLLLKFELAKGVDPQMEVEGRLLGYDKDAAPHLLMLVPV